MVRINYEVKGGAGKETSKRGKAAIQGR